MATPTRRRSLAPQARLRLKNTFGNRERRPQDMNRVARQLLPILAVLANVSVLVAGHGPGQFVRRETTHLMRDKQRLYYLGANCFYLSYFAQDTSVATNGTTWRQMSDEVLAQCKDLGISVVRIWAFNEDNKQEFSAVHGDWRIQTSPGVYREQALVGLDYVLNAANELDLYLVLTLVNNWNDYGGMMWYVTNSPTAGGDHDDFYTDVWCRQWYRNHFAALANRTNTFNGRVYRDDPTIFSWQLANEPRCSTTIALTNWVSQMASYIKSIDTNHMVSTGEEGWEPEWTLNNSCSNIDYAVIHCWPDWWWPSKDDATMYSNAMRWVTDRIATAQNTLGKPIVLSEYGRLHPAWGGPPLDDAYGRNGYYRGWFDAIYSSARADGPPPAYTSG